jgi:hypothetical protein
MSDTEYDSDEAVEIEPEVQIEQDEDADAELDAEVEAEIEEDEEEGEEESDDEVMMPLIEVNQNITKICIIKPENRMTSDFLSVQEQTELVSIRATMISENNDCQVPIDDLVDPIMMGRRELMQRKCPLALRREIGEKKEIDPETKTQVVTKYYEYWDPNEMGFSKIYDV